MCMCTQMEMSSIYTPGNSTPVCKQWLSLRKVIGLEKGELSQFTVCIHMCLSDV